MKKISNAEIARRLYENEKLSYYYSFDEILDIIDSCRTLDEEFLECDAEEIIRNFEFGLLERIYWKNFEN